jgi:hypothetical protein
MTFVSFNINYETFVKIHKTNNKIYKILHMMINVVSLLFKDAMLAFYPCWMKLIIFFHP